MAGQAVHPGAELCVGERHMGVRRGRCVGGRLDPLSQQVDEGQVGVERDVRAVAPVVEDRPSLVGGQDGHLRERGVQTPLCHRAEQHLQSLGVDRQIRLAVDVGVDVDEHLESGTAVERPHGDHEVLQGSSGHRVHGRTHVAEPERVAERLDVDRRADDAAGSGG